MLGACALPTPRFDGPPPEVTGRISPRFSPDRIEYCFGHSCAQAHAVTFAPDQWRQVRALLAEPGADAETERQSIRVAIGMMERFASVQAGTENDLAGTTPIFLQVYGPAQLDCYDEAINTSNFLGLLARDDLLRFHRVRAPVQRWFIGGDYIHATAVIEATTSGVPYAVDSSFHDNGEPAEIVALNAWRAGWRPADDDGSLVLLQPL